METISIEYALLATQHALLDAVTSELRAVVIDISKEKQLFYIRFYYHGNVSAKLIDLWQCAITEASASLDPDCALDNEVERLDYPREIPFRGRYAYLRKEDKPYKSKAVPMEKFSIAYALLAVQNALLGVATPELRAVIVDVSQEENLLYVRFYYHGEAPKELVDLWSCVIKQAKEDFKPECILDEGVERLDCPKKPPFRGRFAYFRRE
jgi:hypothetical protein